MQCELWRRRRLCILIGLSVYLDSNYLHRTVSSKYIILGIISWWRGSTSYQIQLYFDRSTKILIKQNIGSFYRAIWTVFSLQLCTKYRLGLILKDGLNPVFQFSFQLFVYKQKLKKIFQFVNMKQLYLSCLLLISLPSLGTWFLFKRESSLSLDFDTDLPGGISDAFFSNNRPLQLPSVWRLHVST